VVSVHPVELDARLELEKPGRNGTGVRGDGRTLGLGGARIPLLGGERRGGGDQRCDGDRATAVLRERRSDGGRGQGWNIRVT
jgi:hypothetical protein